MNLDWLQSLYWREPLWALLALQPLLLMLARGWWRRRRLRDYADPQLRPWVMHTHHRRLMARLFSRDAAYITAWILFALAAMGPRLPEEIPGQAVTESTDIMLVVDVSRSMRATDITPNRRRRAVLEIRELLQALARHGERVGIIVYAAKPHVYVPLTGDMEALEFYLEEFDALRAPTHGSRAYAALDMARAQLAQARRAAVIWISDGDFAGWGGEEREKLKQAAMALGRAGISLQVLGMGSVEGDAVPDGGFGFDGSGFDVSGSGGFGADGGGAWLTHQGRPVVSRNDEDLLRSLASMGGGRYSRVRDDDGEWAELYGAGIRAGADSRIEAAAHAKVVWHELYPWALLPGLLLLWLASNGYGLRGRPGLTAGLVVLVLMSPLAPHEARADEWNSGEARDAYALYQAQDWNGAGELYAAIKSYSGRMGEGASRYRQGRYGAALAQYTQAVLLAGDDAQRASALYNLGNSYFQLGDYQNAVVAFQDALRYRPVHAATQNNLAFSRELRQVVEQRLARSGRMGRGPREARAEDQVEISELGAVSLDDSADKQQAERAARLNELDPRTLDMLIARGMEQVRLAGGGERRVASPDRASPAQALGDSELDMAARIRNLDAQNALLWQRLFEAEEGFPAPLARPKRVLGVDPW